MPVDLSKDIDECSTFILIISLQKEMKGRSHWLSVRCHSNSCTVENWLGCVKIEAIWALDVPVGWLDKEYSGLLFNMKIFRILPINPLPLIILRRQKICQQYSPIDFYSHPSHFTAGCLCGDMFSPLSGDAFLSPPLPQCQMFLDRKQVAFLYSLWQTALITSTVVPIMWIKYVFSCTLLAMLLQGDIWYQLN